MTENISSDNISEDDSSDDKSHTASSYNSPETIKHKCMKCKNKPSFILNLNNVIQCVSCKEYIHKGCLKKTKFNTDGSIQYCCGVKEIQPLQKLDNQPSQQNTTMDHIEFPEIDADKIITDINNVDKSQVPENQKALLNAINDSIIVSHNNLQEQINSINNNIKKIDTKTENLNCRINNTEGKINTIIDRLVITEKNIDILNTNEMQESMIKEFIRRQSKEGNFIIFNFPDSPNANKSDLATIKNLLSNYNLNNIHLKTTRLGKNFIENSNRPMKVLSNSGDLVYWVFQNRKNIFQPNISIQNDLTIAQQESYKKLKEELQHRINNGEKDLIIKYRNGVHFIQHKIVKANKKINKTSQSNNTINKASQNNQKN